MLSIQHVQVLIQHGDYAFSIDLKNTYLHTHIVKHQCQFDDLFGKIWHISGRLWPTPRVFTALTKPILFLCQHKVFYIVTYLDNILVLVHF